MGDGITDNGGSTGSDPITGFYSEPFWTEVNSEESYCPARRDGRNFAPVEVEGRYVCPTDHVGVLERPNSFSEGHPSDAFDSVIDGQSNHDAAPQLAATTEEATGHQASWQSCNSDFMISLGLHNGFGREQTSIFSGGGYFIVGTDRADFALAMPMQIMSAVHACQESGYFTTDQANAKLFRFMIHRCGMYQYQH